MSRRKLLTLAAGSTLGVAGAGVGTWAWLTRRGRPDDPTAGPRPTSTARPANVPSRAVWWAKINRTDETFTPMPVGDLILVMDDDGLIGLDAKTGEKRWTHKWEIWSAEGIKIRWQVVSDGERAYAFIPETSTAKGLAVHAVDLENGKPRPLIGPFSDFFGSRTEQAQPLTAADGAIYIVAQRWKAGPVDNEKGWHVLAADLRSGKELWRRPFKGDYFPDTSREGIVANAVGNRLALTRRIAGYDALDGVGARDTRTGRLVWSWDLPRERLDPQSFLVPGQLAADQQHVYFGTGELYAFRLSDGDKAWTFGAGRDKGDIKKGERPYGRPAVKDGVVYVAEGTRGLVAIEADSGKPLWEVSLGGMPNLLATPVIGSKYAYVAVDGNAKISAVDLRTHKVAWSLRVPGNFGGAFVAHDRAATLVWMSGDFVCAIPFE